jgi:DNA (cytosine-5)-methyltransferase 1
MTDFTVGSLFAGIGGLDLGLELAGMNVIWQSEIEPYCCRVLAKHWPDIPNLGDVREVDWSTVERPDLICGGYPCQPFSLAGARRGETDERHLWPAMRDAIRVLRPRYALLENVPGHLSLGFDRVLGDLADVGYDATWDCIPAAAVGAPHLRYRLFVVAYPQRDELREQPVAFRWGSGVAESRDDGPQRLVADSAGFGEPDEQTCRDAALQSFGTVAGTGDRTRRGNRSSRVGEHGRGTRVMATVGDPNGVARETGSPHKAQRGTLEQPGAVERLERPACGLGDQWAVEPDVGRVAHGIPSRVDRLRALGNAVVPQVAEWIGQQILASLERAT